MQYRNAIVHLIAGTDIGGAEMLVLNIAKFFNKEDIKFIIIATQKGVLFDEIEKTGCSIEIIKRRFALDPFYIYKLCNLSLKNDVLCLHSHGLLECLNGWVVTSLLRRKLFMTYHGFNYFSKNKIVEKIGIFVSKKVEVNIFVSKHLENYYEMNYNIPASRSVVLYNGLLIPELTEYDNTKLSGELEIEGDALIMGMTGNFSAARNQLLICKAFRLLLNDNTIKKNVHLVFIGQTDLGCNASYQTVMDYCMANKLTDRVHFAGSRANAYKLLHNFDLFVYATHRETFCLSVVEAIIAGVPVLVNNIPVIKEITREGRLANLYETGNEIDLKNKMERILLDIQKYKLNAIANSKVAKREYSISRHIENLFKIYQTEY